MLTFKVRAGNPVNPHLLEENPYIFRAFQPTYQNPCSIGASVFSVLDAILLSSRIAQIWIFVSCDTFSGEELIKTRINLAREHIHEIMMNFPFNSSERRYGGLESKALRPGAARWPKTVKVER